MCLPNLFFFVIVLFITSVNYNHLVRCFAFLSFIYFSSFNHYYSTKGFFCYFLVNVLQIGYVYLCIMRYSARLECILDIFRSTRAAIVALDFFFASCLILFFSFFSRLPINRPITVNRNIRSFITSMAPPNS